MIQELTVLCVIVREMKWESNGYRNLDLLDLGARDSGAVSSLQGSHIAGARSVQSSPDPPKFSMHQSKHQWNVPWEDLRLLELARREECLQILIVSSSLRIFIKPRLELRSC